MQYDIEQELGFSQLYFTSRTAHIVEVFTDEGLTGIGEIFGAGNVALGNSAIVERVMKPMIVGENPLYPEVIWHKVYNLLRDHGQKGMPISPFLSLHSAQLPWSFYPPFVINVPISSPLIILLSGYFIKL